MPGTSYPTHLLLDGSSKPEAPIQLLPGELLSLQMARPHDALLASRRLRREPPGVRPDSYPPQVQPVGIPAHAHGRVRAQAAVGMLLAGKTQQIHLLALKVEHLSAQLPGQLCSPRAVQGVLVVVEPHGVVKEGEQENERRVDAWRLREKREPCRGDPLPVAFAVYRGILARGPFEDGSHEPSGVGYGDARRNPR
jgi:hypothetical protein